MGDITWSPMVVEPLQLMKKTIIPPNWSAKMGGDGTFQGIHAIPTLFSEN